MDLTEFYLSAEWDIIMVPATRYVKMYYDYKPFPFILFNITLRRKTLYYTINLITPCVGISGLSVLVFYLPSDSGEKVALCITIELALVMFFLLLSEITPSTSLAVPLLGKYLMFTMILVTLSIFTTITIINVHYRSPHSHKMAPWVRRVFIQLLPRFLLMTRPHYENTPTGFNPTAGKQQAYDFGQSAEGSAYLSPSDRHTGLMGHSRRVESDDCASLSGMNVGPSSLAHRRFCTEIDRALNNVIYIAQHVEQTSANVSVSIFFL